MREYHASLTAVAPDPATLVENEAIERFRDDLEDLSPGVSAGPGRVSAALSIEAIDQVEALHTAIRRFNDAGKVAEIIDWPSWTIVKAGITDWDEFERELEQPIYPPILGITELAELLDVSRQRASQIARNADFPKPYAELASGPVWFEPNVRQFVEQWERRPGRPPKETFAVASEYMDANHRWHVTFRSEAGDQIEIPMQLDARVRFHEGGRWTRSQIKEIVES